MPNMFFEHLEFSSLQMWIGVGVCVFVALMALYLGLTTMRRPEHMPLPDDKSVPNGDESEPKPKDKRAEGRRKGRHTPVDITITEVRESSWTGWVTDRSSGGLKVVSDRSVEAGAELQIRVTEQAQFMPWIEIKVKHCKPISQGWELGCQFVRKPTWNILMSFG